MVEKDYSVGEEMKEERELIAAVITEQEPELIAEITEEADSNLAHHLQMQEAMNASLALQPSTSSSPPSPEENPVSAAAGLMLDDLKKKFMQEAMDHKLSQLEFNKEKEELYRRLHDKSVATDIDDLSERDGSLYGNSSDKPHCPRALTKSSSATACLRLYSKGLLSNELRRGENVVVAGAGIAFCDLNDGLVHGAWKNLEPQVAGRDVTDEMVKLSALIEGLDRALRLGFKKLTIVTDDDVVYQYLCGREAPHRKIAALLNQIHLLQRQYTECSSSLVAPNNGTKVAHKLARDSILSQITWTDKAGHDKHLRQTCRICLEDFDVDHMFSVAGCQHRYCHSCIEKYTKYKFSGGKEAYCPEEHCNSKLSADECAKFLEPSLYEKAKQLSIPVCDRVYCPNPRCSALMSKPDVLRFTETINIDAEDSGMRKCTKCSFLFCVNCKVRWHAYKSCEEFQSSQTYLESDDHKNKKLVKDQGWASCPKCYSLVELLHGCNHITCWCEHEFCYVCLAQWSKIGPNCVCPPRDAALLNVGEGLPDLGEGLRNIALYYGELGH